MWVTPSFAQTPFQLETGHNTTACSNSNMQAYCMDGFPVGDGPWDGGWCDNRFGTDGSPVIPRVWNPGVGDYRSGYPGNVSKGRGTPPWPDQAHPGDVHNLLYPGNTTRIFALVQYFFSTEEPITQVVLCDPVPDKGQPCTGISQSFSFSGQHKMSGYSNNTVAYSDAAAKDLWERGFDGAIANTARALYTCPQEPLSSGMYHGQTDPDFFTAQCSGDGSLEDGLHKLQQAMLAYPADQFQFVMQIDENAFMGVENCHCKSDNCDFQGPDGSDYFQAQCIRDQLKALLRKYNQDGSFFKTANYLTPAPNSPVVQFFVWQGYHTPYSKPGGWKGFLWQCSKENPCIVSKDVSGNNVYCYGQEECWQKVWSGLREYAKDELGLNPYLLLITLDNPPCLYDAKAGSFDTTEGDGCFLWPQSNDFPATLAKQLDWGRQDYVDFHYENWSKYNGVKGANGHPALFFGGAWKGHDTRFTDIYSVTSGPVHSGPERGAGLVTDQQYWAAVTSQRSGQTWVDMFAEAGRYFSVHNQLPYFIVVSYDDYESGHEFQTGIDNGASVAVSLKGPTLSWTTTFDSEYGSAKTLHHYRLFDSPDGVSVNVLQDNIPPRLNGSLNIAGLPVEQGAHKLYLKLVGKAGIFNKVSDAGGADGGLSAFTLTVSKPNAKGGAVLTGDRTISCGTGCLTQTALYGANTSIMLRALPSAGYRFAGWSGACVGTTPTCLVDLIAARNVTADFEKR
jgi:hypothetical protein